MTAPVQLDAHADAVQACEAAGPLWPLSGAFAVAAVVLMAVNVHHGQYPPGGWAGRVAVVAAMLLTAAVVVEIVAAVLSGEADEVGDEPVV